jgi:antitoxin component YwqK of YwqJK toxin-antitoxin module
MLLFKTLAILALGSAIGDVRTIQDRDKVTGKLMKSTEVKDIGREKPVKHGLEITYFSDGFTEESRYHYQNDELDGPWKEFYSSGGDSKPSSGGNKVKVEGTYHHGVKNGVETRYSLTHEKIEQAEYKDGKLNGQHTEWGPDGKKTYEATYKNGIIEGTVSRWHADEKQTPRSVTHYVHGDQEGLDQRFYENGKPFMEAEFHEGKKNGLYREWYIDGTLKLEAHYKDGMLEGKETQWYADHLKKSEGMYRKGQLIGLYTEWHDKPEEPIKVLTKYENGQPQGVAMRWHANGQKELEVNFKDGKHEGRFLEWYDNGQVKCKGKYKDDKFEGPIWFYFEDGKEQALNTYKKGLRDGHWAELDEKGNLIRDQYYSEGILVLDQIKKAAAEAAEKERAANRE